MNDEITENTQKASTDNHEQDVSLENKQVIQKKHAIIAILVAVIIVSLIVTATIFLFKSGQEQTAQVRDVFIIFLALESMVTGIALVILIIQLSTLINLLHNEIRPIITSTSETVNTLKGTAKFVSDNLAEPVIKINQYAAMVKRLVNPSKK